MRERRNKITRFAWRLLLLLLLAVVNWRGASGPAGLLVAIAEPSDILPIVSIGDAAQVEGHSDTRPMVFDVTLKTTPTQTMTVSYKTTQATAQAHLDYVQISGVLTFAPGEVHKTITIHIIGDSLFERDELFYVTLVHAVNGLIGDGLGRGTIIDDDYGLFLPVVMNRP